MCDGEMISMAAHEETVEDLERARGTNQQLTATVEDLNQQLGARENEVAGLHEALAAENNRAVSISLKLGEVAEARAQHEATNAQLGDEVRCLTDEVIQLSRQRDALRMVVVKLGETFILQDRRER